MVTKDKLDKIKSSETGKYFYEHGSEILHDGIRIERTKDTGGIATITYYSKADKATYTAILIKEDGFWRIQDYISLKEEMDRIMKK